MYLGQISKTYILDEDLVPKEYKGDSGGGGGGDITLKTLDVTSNGTYTSSAGEAYNKVVANVEPETVSETFTQNGTYNPPSGKYFDEVVVDVSGGKQSKEQKDVNFWDYDGTVLYSYTKDEFLALDNMPTHAAPKGLVSDGWNWTFTDCKTHVEEYGGCNVGALYNTDDNSTRIYVLIEDEDRKTLKLNFGFTNSGGTISWGDGKTSTVTTGQKLLSHTYSNIGEYCISIKTSVINGGIRLGDNGFVSTYTTTSNIFGNMTTDQQFIISRVEIGKTCTEIGKSCFLHTMYSSDPILASFPNERIKIGSVSSLSPVCASIPSNSILHSSCVYPNLTCYPKMFNHGDASNQYISYGGYAYKLKNVYITSNVHMSRGVRIDYQMLYSARKVVFGNVKSLATTVTNVKRAKTIDFTHCTSVPGLKDSSFAQVRAPDLKILVPNSLLSQWKTATNWAALADYIVGV